jgi:hypothetical protein
MLKRQPASADVNPEPAGKVGFWETPMGHRRHRRSPRLWRWLWRWCVAVLVARRPRDVTAPDAPT